MWTTPSWQLRPPAVSPLQTLKCRHNCLMNTYWCVTKPPRIIFPCLLFFMQHHIWYSAQETRKQDDDDKRFAVRTSLSMFILGWLHMHVNGYVCLPTLRILVRWCKNSTFGRYLGKLIVPAVAQGAHTAWKGFMLSHCTHKPSSIFPPNSMLISSRWLSILSISSSHKCNLPPKYSGRMCCKSCLTC